jgi:hypothetical protein
MKLGGELKKIFFGGDLPNMCIFCIVIAYFYLICVEQYDNSLYLLPHGDLLWFMLCTILKIAMLFYRDG